MKLKPLLNYLLKEQVEEGIRNVSPGMPFNIREFKALDDLEEIHWYVNDRLEEIGEGSSRKVFILSPRFALKIASLADDGYDDGTATSEEKGLAQNEAEFNTYMEAKDSNIIPKVQDYHKYGYWLLTELVRPFNTLEEWEETTGMRWEQLVEFTKYMMDDEYAHDEYDRNNFVDQPVLVALCDLVIDHDLEPNDICGIPQWGKTADGRAVLLDAGGTKEVLERYYSIVF